MRSHRYLPFAFILALCCSIALEAKKTKTKSKNKWSLGWLSNNKNKRQSYSNGGAGPGKSSCGSGLMRLFKSCKGHKDSRFSNTQASTPRKSGGWLRPSTPATRPTTQKPVSTTPSPPAKPLCGGSRAGGSCSPSPPNSQPGSQSNSPIGNNPHNYDLFDNNDPVGNDQVHPSLLVPCLHAPLQIPGIKCLGAPPPPLTFPMTNEAAPEAGQRERGQRQLQ